MKRIVFGGGQRFLKSGHEQQPLRGHILRLTLAVLRWAGPAALAAVTLGLPASGSAGEPSPSAVTTPGASAAAPVRLPRIEDFAPAEEFVMVGAIKTHFVRKGETGRPVVLVHGFGSSTVTWQKTIDALSTRYRVYAFDMKGFGLSAKPKDGQYHARAYVEQLVGFLDVMKLDRPVLVGHSLGGAIVSRVALLHPDRVGGLVLVDPVPVTLPRNEGALMKRAGVDVGVNPPGTAADKAALLNPALASRLLPVLLRSAITRQTVETGLKVAYHDPKFVTPEMVEIYYRPITIEGAAEAIASMWSAPKTPDAPLPPLSGLNLPALVAWGRHDQVVPAELFEKYVSAIPGARKVVFPNSGHVPHEEEAEDFNARLLEFLAELP